MFTEICIASPPPPRTQPWTGSAPGVWPASAWHAAASLCMNPRYVNPLLHKPKLQLLQTHSAAVIIPAYP